MKALCNFWNDDQGQDLIEYTLLMAFVHSHLSLSSGCRRQPLQLVRNSHSSRQHKRKLTRAITLTAGR